VTEPQYDILDRVSPVGIIHADPQGRWVSANQRWCRWAGLQLEKSLGSGWLRAVHPDDRAPVQQQWQRAVERVLPLHCEFRMNHPGGLRWVLIQTEPQYNGAGEVTGFIGAITDISKRVDLEDERRQLLDDLNDRIAQLTTLHQAAVWLQNHAARPQQVLEHLMALLPASWQDGSAVSVRLTYGSASCATPQFRLAADAQISRFETTDGTSGQIELFHHLPHRPRPARHEQPTRYLVDALAQMLCGHFNRMRAEQELVHSEQRFRTMVANLPGAVYRCAADATWTMHYISDQVQAITGHPAPDFIGNRVLHFNDLVFAQDQPSCREIVTQSIARHEPYELEFRLRHADGSTRWVYERGQPVFDSNGELLWLDGAVFDITPQKQTVEIQRDRNHLRAALRAHENVLAVVGHELRTPLAASRAVAELLLSDEIADPAQRRDFLTTLHEQTVRMATMINNLLEVARVSSGTARWQWATVALGPICQRAIDAARPLLGAKAIDLTLKAPCPEVRLRGDAEALQRLLDNLLSNACRFTHQGRIELAVTACSDRTAGIVVRDTGTGMPAALALQAGQPLAYLTGINGQRQGGGAGLGLAICHGIVSAHGGRMTIESAPGEGTVVTINLPTLQDQAALHAS
jgi:PAS domain S-box-containing protein